MVIVDYLRNPPNKRIMPLDRQILAIARARYNKAITESVDALDKVANRIDHARRLYKSVLIDNPDLDIFLKNQLTELDRIIREMETRIE